MNKKQRQQGDVLIQEISSLPKGLKKVNKDERFGKFILAYGEHTGHKHMVVDEEVELFQDEQGVLYLKTNKETELVHEEHKTIKIPAGIQKVTIVREKDHLLDLERQVRD